MAYNTLKNKRVLITCGPTWVPIDSVRVISNLSSGQLGQTIAQDLSNKGAEVTLVEGEVAKPLNLRSVKVIKFRYYTDLLKIVRKELNKRYDIIVHAAAVSDYMPERTQQKKIKSNLSKLTLRLTPTKKIINSFKKQQPKAFLVGFKLESSIAKSKIRPKLKNLFQEAKCDLIVANTLSQQSYKGIIVDPHCSILATASNRRSISQKLTAILRKNK